MRIGDYDLRNIREKILTDLYGKSEEKFEKRKEEIAKQNREYFIEPLMSTIVSLPIELIAHTNQYSVKIKYTSPSADKKENPDIIENWGFRSNKPIPNPKDPSKNSGSYYESIPDQPLDPRLHDITAQLCEEILKLQIEKSQMSNYLADTTRRYKGSIQLRKVWPESLHKYLPPEPVKIPKKSKEKISKDDPEIPDHLTHRLTENLLEGE
tara:strand:- start:554 stop:1183 length:630 start_codon:yes stop_codon:yes gene_type:complete